MSVHKKLMAARMQLQNTPLKKTGKNEYAGFEYFELGDFLPTIQAIFSGLGLCGTISFGKELATLTVRDVDGDGEIVFTSPMEPANLKGCHPIQNLGAVETYQRRYLWVTALEIVEHDVLDASVGKEKTEKEHQRKMNSNAEERVRALADSIDASFHIDGVAAAATLKSSAQLGREETVYLWGLLSEEVRNAIKEYVNKEKAK